MIALGAWQLQRRGEKAALVARYAANLNLPPMAYPELAPVPAEAMFRTSQVRCLRVANWRSEAGRSAQGRSGYRHIADCVTGAEGPGALVDLGVSSDPAQQVAWNGGTVDGVITTEPNHASLIGRLFTREPALRPMLVATAPATGLAASAPPDPSDVPNNHFAYAVQWFVFAGAAAVIYTMALRRKSKSGSGS
ncbi:SURF1 family protein [Sphingomonas sp. SUN039]|uniref:SURF1 family protein n=1 Tax=Sphingomonas sp. SUN039 TaxID=2937787 RepID=UPI002164B1DA|nr:SURF1 family protein [Sphingomonas sp. SUN039]UVO55079.1 SURF1 family protein [Sphingomonas sp. SUN039]